MLIPLLCSILAIGFFPSLIQAQERVGVYRSPPILLESIDLPPRSGYALVMRMQDRGKPTYGVEVTRAIGGSMRLGVGASLGPASSPLLAGSDGAMVSGALVLSHKLLTEGHYGVDAVIGVQAERNTGSEATRFGTPVGLLATATWQFGPVALTPILSGGVAMRWDNLQANQEDVRLTLEEGSTRSGWHAGAGVQLRYHSLWIQPSWAWSKMIEHSGAGFPLNEQVLSDGTVYSTQPHIRPATQFTLKIGFSP